MYKFCVVTSVIPCSERNWTPCLINKELTAHWLLVNTQPSIQFHTLTKLLSRKERKSCFLALHRQSSGKPLSWLRSCWHSWIFLPPSALPSAISWLKMLSKALGCGTSWSGGSARTAKRMKTMLDIWHKRQFGILWLFWDWWGAPTHFCSTCLTWSVKDFRRSMF